MIDLITSLDSLVLDWQCVPEIEAAHAAFKGRAQCVFDFGEMIIELGMQDFCGPFMLHRHYDILGGECLVRSYSGQQFEARPGVWHPGLIPCAYTFVATDGGSKTIPFEYVDVDGAPIEAVQECRKLGARIPDVDRSIAILPIEARSTLGLMILHPEPDLSGEMFWLEESDEVARVSITRSVLKRMYSIEERAHFIQTSWIFKNGRVPTVGRACDSGTKYKSNCIDKHPTVLT